MRPNAFPEDMEHLMDETVRLFHALRAVALHLHREEGITATERGILRELAAKGPRTVPQMARERLVSRQNIQSVVRQLNEKGWTQVVSNPAHRRSGLIELTPAGWALVETIARREREVLSRFPLDGEAPDLKDAARTLAVVGEGMRKLLQTPEASEGETEC